MYRLYRINFADVGSENIESMYFRGHHFELDTVEKKVVIQKGGHAETSTYFNAFSIGKWSKYTKLTSVYLRVRIKGRGRIVLKQKYLEAGDYLERTASWMTFDTENVQEYSICFSDLIGASGIVYVRIESAGKPCILEDAEYMTKDLPEAVRIGVGICTYRREAYVRRLIRKYETYENQGKLGIFIADNGNSLEPVHVDGVSVFPNKNYGGAAGFTRCILEIKKRSEQEGYTHIVLMDDDISVDFSIFDKMTSFLSYLKEECSTYFLAGAMCSLDYPFLQYERYSSWRGDGFVQFGPGYDLRDFNTIVANEREEKQKNGSAGWWCSCFPIKMTAENNYPFPCFFRGDDVEFTIRNGSKIITLNGVNVWHEPFYRKYSIVSENYYLVRNTLVINALYLPDLSWKENIKFLKKRFLKAIVTYDYQSAELILKALKDYGKGISFFKRTDPEKLNQRLMKKNYKMQHISQVLDEYDFLNIEYYLYHETDRNRLSRFLRLASLNGYLLPKSVYRPFAFSHIGFGCRSRNFYRTRQVFVTDPFTYKGYMLEINKRKAVKLVLQFYLLAAKLGRRYETVKSSYQAGFYELQTEKFWTKYLGLNTKSEREVCR